MNQWNFGTDPDPVIRASYIRMRILQILSGMRIRIDLMRIPTRIRIQHFFFLRIRIQGFYDQKLKKEI